MGSAKHRASLGRSSHLQLPQSLTTRAWDVWILYRLSLALMVLLLLVMWWRPVEFPIKQFASGAMVWLVLQSLINWPHFMVSYAVLYRDKSHWRKYPAATWGIPALLVAALAFGLQLILVGELTYANNFGYLMFMVAAFYLAWHYTGQVWGVMMTGAMLSGLTLSKIERIIFRSSLRILLLWHVIWGLQMTGDFPYLAALRHEALMWGANGLAILGLLTGTGVLAWRWYQRRFLPELFWGPWFTIHLWYLVLWLEPTFAVFVQLSHALQYLIFPAKVEMSRVAIASNGLKGLSTRYLVIKQYLMCAGAGFLVFYGMGEILGATPSVLLFFGMIAAAVNIHHYFTDGAVWKLRDPQVRDLLFR